MSLLRKVKYAENVIFPVYKNFNQEIMSIFTYIMLHDRFKDSKTVILCK